MKIITKSNLILCFICILVINISFTKRVKKTNKLSHLAKIINKFLSANPIDSNSLALPNEFDLSNDNNESHGDPLSESKSLEIQLDDLLLTDNLKEESLNVIMKTKKNNVPVKLNYKYKTNKGKTTKYDFVGKLKGGKLLINNIIQNKSKLNKLVPNAKPIEKKLKPIIEAREKMKKPLALPVNYLAYLKFIAKYEEINASKPSLKQKSDECIYLYNEYYFATILKEKENNKKITPYAFNSVSKILSSKNKEKVNEFFDSLVNNKVFINCEKDQEDEDEAIDEE